MYTGLDHLCWAVKDAEAQAKHFAENLGLRTTRFYSNLDEGYRSAYISLGHCPLELMDPTDEIGPVARLVKRRGDGFDLVALGVKDMAAAISSLRARGARVIHGAGPERGGGMNFIHPLDCHGVLIELASGAMSRTEVGKPIPGRKSTIKGATSIVVAVKDLDKAVETYTKKLGFPQPQVTSQSQAGVRFAHFRLGTDLYGLIQPIAANNPIHRFLEKRGEGVWSVGLEVGNLAAEVKAMKARGVRLVEQEMEIDGKPQRMAFIHPSAAGGVLLQLSQAA